MKETETRSAHLTAALLAQASPKEIALEISKLPESQILEFLSSTNEQNDPLWQVKTVAAIGGLESLASLETAGKGLSFAQIEELLAHLFLTSDIHLWKLSPILVGLSPSVFQEILDNTCEKNLQAFKNEGITEPIQHQLTQLGHALEQEIALVGHQINQFGKEICTLKVEEAKTSDYVEKMLQIDAFVNAIERYERRANKALSIAWNTDRLDLIELFNQVKESCHRYLNYGIGKAEETASKPTGLYHILNNHFFSSFGDSTNPQQPEALRDTEPAIEALAKLSVWYLQDYWEIGLLPKIQNPEDVDLKTSYDKERIKQREELFAEAVNNLARFGLRTVKDLKDHLIFSKKSLKDYISHCLSSKSF